MDTRELIAPLSSPTAEVIRAVGPGAEDPVAAAALVRHLNGTIRFGTDVQLPDIPSDSALGQQLALQWNCHLTQIPYATVALPVDYASLSRSTRRDHRRRERVWRGLREQGHQVTYHRTRCTSELLETYPVLARLHRLQWPGTTNTVTDAASDRRWHAVLERCGPTAFIAMLAVDGAIIAAQLCLRRGDHAYSLIPAMDPTQRELAPGHALLRYLTDDLASTGYRTLDLGRTTDDPGQHAYKSQYGATWSQTLTASGHALLNGGD